MNTNILQKCIVELQKEKPDLSYLRGMLETLVALQEPFPKDIGTKTLDNDAKVILDKGFTPKMDEAAILDAQARTNLAKVQKNSLEIQ